MVESGNAGSVDARVNLESNQKHCSMSCSNSIARMMKAIC